MATVTGTNASDPELEGTALADQIYGLGGNDILIALGGGDTLEGGAGADELFGSEGFDLASYKGSAAAVQVDLSAFHASGGHAAGDRLYSVEGLVGSAFGDGLAGDGGRNVLRGGGGGDQLLGLGGDDTLQGEGGGDTLHGGEGKDRLDGGDGNDALAGGPGDDVLNGGGGVDTVYFGDQEPVEVRLRDGTAHGIVSGDDDLLSGVENATGSLFADTLVGTDGANVLHGRGNADTLVGNGGADRFVYDQADDSRPEAADQIRGFSHAQGDRIDLRYVDANEQAGGDQAFDLIGQGPFTGAGQLRFVHADGGTVIQANTSDATPGAEMAIVLNSLVNLQSGDFLL